MAGEQFEGIKTGAPRDVWVPILTLRRTDPKMITRFDQRRASWLEMFGRLKPGVTFEQARTQFAAIASRLEQAYPETNARAGSGMAPGLGRDPDVRNEIRRFAYLPFAAVGIVLVIACANVAGLLLARAAGRQREIATRLALGAGRVRVIRQLLTESLTLAVAGGAAGLLVGRWLTQWLHSLLPEKYLFLSFNLDFGVDWRVFGFMLAITTATGVVFGLVPALQASRPDLVATLKGSGMFGRRGRGLGLRGTLVVTEVALALILLVAAGLFVRTLQNAVAIDTGYESGRVLTARIDLARQNYAGDRGPVFQRQLIDRLHARPEVDAAGFAVTLPLNDGRWEDSIRRDGDPTRIQTFQNIVSPRYFDTMNVRLLAGRQFSEQDDERSPRVAILNQTLARVMWPDGALGKRLTFKNQAIEVIGVVRDIKGRNLFESPGPMLYVPLFQSYQPNVVLHVRTRVPPAQVIAAVRREVQALDKDLPVYSVKALDEHVTATLTPQRLLAHLISGFGMLALVLAGIGMYGLLAHMVSERTSEIGVRMALGADRNEVVRLFVTRGMKLALAGVALGMAARVGIDAPDQEPALRREPARPVDVDDGSVGAAPDRARGVLCAGTACGHGRSEGRSPLRLKGHGRHVGFAEVVSLEQERLPDRLRQGVGEAIAVVEACKVTTFAEPAIRMSGKIRLSGVDGHYLDRRLVNQKIQFSAARIADAGFDHDRRLEQSGGREQSDRIGFYRAAKGVRIGLVQQDREDRGGVEHHQRGRPRSS